MGLGFDAAMRVSYKFRFDRKSHMKKKLVLMEG